MENLNTLALTVADGITVTVFPNSEHEFLMTSKEVALGYGISEGNLRNQLHRNFNEFIEGKHYGTAVCFSNSEPNAPRNKLYWTKRGVVRLGFFIKSEQARIFRDTIEDFVIEQSDPEILNLKDKMLHASSVIGSMNKLAKRMNISPATFTNLIKRPSLLSAEMRTRIDDVCTNIIENGIGIDPETVGFLLRIDDREARLGLWKKFQC